MFLLSVIMATLAVCCSGGYRQGTFEVNRQGSSPAGSGRKAAALTENDRYVLDVGDAFLSGNIRYSGADRSSPYSTGWINEGDSVFWTLNIRGGGLFRAEMQYRCSPGQVGSVFILSSETGEYTFTIEWPFEPADLPGGHQARRSDPVERTWSWMTIGGIHLKDGKERIVLKLSDLAADSAAVIKSIRFTRQ